MFNLGKILVFILLALLSKYHQQSGSSVYQNLARSWSAHASQLSCERPETSAILLIAHYRHTPPDQNSSPDGTLIYLATLLLVHDVEINPGPRPPDHDLTVYPCGKCKVPIDDHVDPAIQCDGCDAWHHVECQNLHTLTIERLEEEDATWHCSKCEMPNRIPSFLMDPSFDLLSEDSHDTVDVSDTDFVSPGPPGNASTPKHTRRKKIPSNARVLLLNARSIDNKRGSFQNITDTTNSVVVAATETWLKDVQADGEIGQPARFSSEFKIHRKDRDPEKKKNADDGGGGVFIAVKKDFADSYRQTYLENDSETVWVKIDIKGRKPQFACCFYRSNVSDVDSLNLFKKSYEKLLETEQNPLVWVFGDFNLPGIKWPETEPPSVIPHCTQIQSHRDFLEFLSDVGLKQMVYTPTREDNILDLFLTNNPSLVSNVQSIPGISDHSAVLADLEIKGGANKQKPTKIPLWNKTDRYLDKFERYIKSQWNSVQPDIKADPEKLWDWFRSTMDYGIKEFVPHRTAGKKDKHPWMSRELKSMHLKEKRLYAKKKKRRTARDVIKLKDLQRSIQRKTRQEYWRYIDGILRPSTPPDPGNPVAPVNEGTPVTAEVMEETAQRAVDERKQPPESKKLYQYIKHCKQDSIGVAPIRDTKTGNLETDAKKKAQLLNNQFFSAFSKIIPLSLSNLCSRIVGRGDDVPLLPEFEIDENGVLKLLGTLKPKKAAGPDQLRPQLLRDLRPAIAPILTQIFRTSLETGRVPSDWRTANVAPIYKKGSKNKAENYRPVSLTCICSKMMEHIIVSQINKHLKKQEILVPYQHGFRESLSCDTQLIKFIEELHAGSVKSKAVDVIVMDFAKAFDKVSHLRLMEKLRGYGIQGKTHRWIESWLAGRTQRVVLEGEMSDYCPVSSGVPQGSVLGPTLFLLYINDIGQEISSTIRLFADDTILYHPISSEADALQLQADLDKLVKWSNDWLMEFHPSKCKLLRVTRSRTPPTNDYTINDTPLESVSSTKYLGVTISSNLKFNKHARQVRGSAEASLNMLKRNLRIRNPELKTAAYNTYVRPRAEYAVGAWDPWTGGVKQDGTHKEKPTGDIGKIEMIQRKAARWVLNKDGHRYRDASVSSMLDQLKWRSLEQRRVDTRLTMLWKIRNEKVHISSSLLIPNTGILHSAHPHRYVPVGKHNADQYNSFFPRTIRQWNRLDSDVALGTCLETFKRRVSCVQHRR